MVFFVLDFLEVLSPKSKSSSQLSMLSNRPAPVLRLRDSGKTCNSCKRQNHASELKRKNSLNDCYTFGVRAAF